MEMFALMPPIRIPQGYQRLSIVGLFVVFPFLSWLFIRMGSYPVFAILGGLLLSGSITISVIQYISLNRLRLQAEVDAKQFQAGSGERHVGIAYCNGIWLYRGETSWDRGFLGFRNGFLTFRGLGPNFCLPTSSIQTAWIAIDGMGVNQLPRLFVNWNHPTTGSNTLSFEIRKNQNRGKCFVEVEELLDWVRRLPREAVAIDETIWPVESTSITLPGPPPKKFG